ncbi:MAG: hypothetical protein AB1591_07090 [Pseudomonadota bacterium]
MSPAWRWPSLLVPALLAGCALTVSHPRALQPMQGFEPLPGDGRVWVEPGAEDYGLRVSQLLDAAIARVEAAHYLPFAHAPRLYVCGSEACFRRYVHTPGLSAAVIPDNRLVLSPRLDGRERWRLQNLLVHELAHLHLGQRAGHYHYNIPVWFHEGWAALTALGGGAEFASDEQALQAAQAGRRIDLGVRDTPDMRHRADAFGLGIHVFYRQAMLMVAQLKDRDADAFRRLALALQDNRDFEIAFWDVYGAGPARILADALQSMPQTGDNTDAKAAAPSATER